jgi:tetratricopeptide (TPR) repeat protein
MPTHRLIALLLLLLLAFQTKAQTESWQELVNRKQYAAVIAYADSLTLADSASFEKMNALALAYEGMLKFRDASRLFRHCLAMDTTNTDILFALARTETNLGIVSKAEHYYKQVLAADSTNFYANHQLARLYFQAEDFEKALDKYLYLLERDDENTTLLRSVGDCYTRLDSPEEACTYYDFAFKTNRENVGLASALINTLLRIGGTAAIEALSVCDTALYYNPGSRLLLQNKGMALFANKKYNEADTLYSRLLTEGDSSYLTLKYTGTSRYYAGQFMNAIDPLELTYTRDTTSVEVNLLLGSVLGKTYDRKRAYVLLDQAEKGMQPDSSIVTLLNLFRAETYSKDRRIKEATDLFYKVWKENPKRIDVLYNILSLTVRLSVSQYESDEARQSGLFICILYVNEFLKTKQSLSELHFTRLVLQSFYEDAFFRNETDLQMLSPDGKRSKISVVDLRSLLNRIPESQL